MNAIESLDTINSWRRVLIEGMSDRIDRMLFEVERTFAAKGWQRRADIEGNLARTPDALDQWRCFVGGPEHGPQLMLGLARVSERRIRGGTYSLLSAAEPAEVAGVVSDVILNVIAPTAADLGLTVTIPRLGYSSQVPLKTLAVLLQFSDFAAGSWPLSPEMERVWQRFVATACRENAAFEAEEMADWFVANGWSPESARQLRDRFLSEAALIAEYNEG